MRVISVTLLAAAVAVVTAKPAGGKKLVTSDIIHGTTEFFYDVAETVYSKFVAHHVEKHSPTITKALEPVTSKLQDPITEVCAKVGCKKAEILGHVEKATAAVTGVKNTVVGKATEVHDSHLTKATHTVIDHFEAALPNQKGLIPRSPLNLVIFTLWIGFVLRYVLTFTGFFLGLLKSFICCFLCCGCCRRSKSAPASTKKANGKTAKKK
eukprot:TRINITY_DN94776_c0_g1_i1.p1 TRINITY_DN94776_c0_g1~~TRINITY_DN94776_c0_g1_i1.p1  ORF type:complete len:210 (+),score=61.07 TRINITY_DN94776_c0_g1_i1:84-713(+)